MTTTPQAALLSESEIVACIAKAGCIGTVKMSYESGPYDIDRPSLNASRLYDAIEAAILAKLQAKQEPVQAGELPEPDGVFYCSEDTGYLTQYRRPPANLTDGDVAMYEADTVRSLLQAALSARKPLTSEQVKALKGEYGYSLAPVQAQADFINGIRCGEKAHGIDAAMRKDNT